MSLTEQQWCPASAQVTVLQARGLRVKGKSGTNDAYAVMQVGKEKFQTSVAEKSVAPVWKEEATFDLPQLLQGGGGGGGGPDRSTLHVHVLHRALVGPDKLLGQAVINLLQLSDDKSRNKTEWFKLLDKTGKPDKERGEVLVDIQFMRNNMTASMFDLSAAGKSRSRLGKIKDKVRGKKKESDSASSIVPSLTQVLTDSEEEEAANGDAEGKEGKDGKSKKHKRKSLFAPKSNLQKNMSQSMSVLPGKNSSLSGSQSSGLNVDSSEGKKKFKFTLHKRSGSSDTKSSFSGHQKQAPVEQSNLCINGSHIYCEEPQTRTARVGSNFSLISSGHGSMEDVPENSPPSVDSLEAVKEYSPWMEEEEEEVGNVKDVDESRKEEEERIKMEEERRKQEEETLRRQQEELERFAKEKLRREEEERLNVQREAEERKRREEEKEMLRQQEELERLAREKLRQEEEERRKAEEERAKREEEERKRREEEELLRQEELEKLRQEEEERRKAKEEEQKKLAEEKRRAEEEERRKLEEEKRQREEEERNRREEEEEKARERKRQDEERRLAEQKRLQEEEEKQRVRRETERAEEERQMEEELVRKQEEQRRQREEEERLKKEEMRRLEEEEERARKEREEYERLMEEKRRQEEERRIEAEEKIRKEEEERARMEEEKRQREQEERRRREEELEKLAKEKLRQEEEKREAEERAKKEEEERIQKEEERRWEEEEKRRKEEEKRVKKEREENERLEEKRRLEEQEKRKMEEKERIRKEEQEKIRKEEEKRKREEERARKEKEEYERLEEERKRLEEQAKRKEEEERVRREEMERKEEEAKKAEEKQKENKTNQDQKVAKKKSRIIPVGIISTNPFDEDFSPSDESSSSAPEPQSRTTKAETVPRCRSAVPSATSSAVSTDETDLNNAQREKRPAPQPPERNQPERLRHKEEDLSTSHPAQINKQNKEKDVRTASVPPQRSVQMIAPLNRSPKDVKSETQNSCTKISTTKRPAPSRPLPVEEELSPAGRTSHREVSEHKPVKTVQTLNPFDDEDDENELTAKDDVTISGSTSPSHWPSAEPQTVDKDAASQPKLKSPKEARAPAPPAPTGSSSSRSIHWIDGGPLTEGPAPTTPNEACDPEPEAKSHTQVQESPNKDAQPAKVQNGMVAGVKEEGPPVNSRRLQTVKPLSPLEQQPASVVQEENTKSAGLHCSGVQQKTKVGAVITGPYSQLTREELISLVLKQEKQLADRDKKISELEQYIDNLLVRVIEVQPSILMAMSALK
ncbi:trichohyalin-like [Kryptolebias marmoratus]|uniref:Trichohyalin-like n=1 Tax=Kryptolebias marmoratus TaxID=37003 RepID=A0A3Q3AIA9_KRYMA|nr:trichohyalin-like [Kryptolebias marmoratus]